MFDIASLSGTLSAIKSAKDVGAALVELRDFNQVATTVTKLNGELLKAQEGLFAMHTKMLELHLEKEQMADELRELRKGLDQRRRYDLVELSAGVFAYRLKAAEHRQDDVAVNGHEPVHYICQPCLDIRGERAFLRRRVADGRFVKFNCPTCREDIRGA